MTSAQAPNQCECFYECACAYLGATVHTKEIQFDRNSSQNLDIQQFCIWLKKHFWSGLQTEVWSIHKGFSACLSASDCPLLFLTKTLDTQAYYWPPSIRLSPFHKWWNVIWFRAVPLRRICQREWHQKVSHKERCRSVCLSFTSIFVRTNVDILACPHLLKRPSKG